MTPRTMTTREWDCLPEQYKSTDPRGRLQRVLVTDRGPHTVPVLIVPEPPGPTETRHERFRLTA